MWALFINSDCATFVGVMTQSYHNNPKLRVKWIDYQDPISHKERWGIVVLGASISTKKRR